MQGERLRVYAARALPLDHGKTPGTLLMASKAGIDIACALGALRLLIVQRDGGRALPVAEFINARSQLGLT